LRRGEERGKRGGGERRRNNSLIKVPPLVDLPFVGRVMSAPWGERGGKKGGGRGRSPYPLLPIGVLIISIEAIF